MRPLSNDFFRYLEEKVFKESLEGLCALNLVNILKYGTQQV